MHRAWLVGFAVIAITLSAPVFASDRAAAASTIATVQIVYPLNNAALGVAGTRVQLKVTDFVLDPTVTPLCVDPGHGRIRLYLNDTFVQETSDANTSLSSLLATHTKLGAQLVCTDGSSFDPQVWHNVTIRVGEPSVTIIRPPVPRQVSTAGARIEYTITNFILDPANYAGPPIPGQGHVHLYRNRSSLIGTSTAPFADIAGFPAGPFNLTVELHNNDHSLVTTASHPFGYNHTIAVVGVVPSIRIVSPSPAGSVSSSGFRLTVAVTGVELDADNYGGAKIPGHGHMHYFIDGGGLAATSTAPFVDFGALPTGPHTFKAELHNNDHSLYTDAFRPNGFNATVSATVAQTAIAIVTPTNNDPVGTGGFRMQLRIDGLDLSPANYGGTKVPGQGHVHLFEGSTLIGTTTSTVFDTGSLTAGAHTLKAEIHNNDHSLFTDGSHPDGFNATVTVTAAGPSITILSPAANAAVSSQGFRITVGVSGLVLDPENYGGLNVPGHGHVHFYEGTQLLGTSTSTSFDLTLSAGTHTIRAELRNNDHTALSPAVSAQVTVTVGAPGLRILEPIAGSAVSALGFRMRFAVSNFSLDAADYGGVAVPGQGHIHVYDGLTLLTTTVFDHTVIGILPAGTVTLRAELRNNDHSVLASPVTTTVTLTVTPPSISLSAPASIVAGQDLVVTWSVSGFVLDGAAFGGAPEAGRGHVHVFVDGTYVAATPGTSFVVSNLAVGSHAIKVRLYNNDHSELAQEFSSEKTVAVNAAAAPGPAVVDANVFYGSTGLLAAIVIVLAALLARKGRKRPPEGAQP